MITSPFPAPNVSIHSGIDHALHSLVAQQPAGLPPRRRIVLGKA
jgi:hypothetical protein